MIYQLAKTSPLLTGQVKMNMILSGNKVVDIQYVPISNHIPFNYNNPIDVLNYSHGDNVKALYNRISEQFFSEVTDPTLTVNHLHRYDTLRDDTHENTYEMGMKRLEYKRYKKQFEFFCPIWCSNLEDLDTIRFMINLANKNGRTMYSKEIVFSDEIKQYIRNIYPSLKFEDGITENNDLLYINFNEVQSHIKGLHVESGALKTIDTSYIVNNLLSQERPVLETDNMLVGLFSQNKTICTQLFNFNFVFDMEDFLPINMLKDLILERVNVYIDVINKDKIAPVKDIYSNYEFIPKYDIQTGKYSNTANVLDYLGDNKSIELINKNKLTQGTFHWVLENNRTSIFNLYNGFSPLNNGQENCTAISNDAPDMFTDEFNNDKNPLGIFKVIDASDPNISAIEFFNLLNDDNNYVSVSFDGLNNSDYTFFGNILLSNKKLVEFLKTNKKITNDNWFFPIENPSGVSISNINKLYCTTFRIPSLWNKDKLKGITGNDYNLYGLFNGYYKKNVSNTIGRYEKMTVSDENFMACKLDSNKNLYFILFTKEDDDILRNTISFGNFYDRICDFVDMNIASNNPEYKNVGFNDNKKNKEFLNDFKKVLDFIGSIYHCAKFPNDILFEKSVSNKLTNSPSENSNEIELLKIDKFVELYRYDSKLLPMFIDLDEPIFKNYLYWCKQYDRNIQFEINNSTIGISKDTDDIKTYSKFALKKFSPLYKSLGYYVLNPTDGIKYKKSVSELTPINYNDYYLTEDDGYYKEISWYKNNSMIYLPSSFSSTIVKKSNENITEDDIVKEIVKYLNNESEVNSIMSGSNSNITIEKLVKYYIKDLYLCTYTYDYVSTDDISKQKYEIKFTLK